MRQFGIGLLMVHEDAGVGNQWPYRTPDFLREIGSAVFLPITFGLIYVPESGNLSILRKLRDPGREWADETAGQEGCFSGYALDMATDIRTESVNLLTGMFGLSYTAFADFVCNPKKEVGGIATNLPNRRDYRDPDYRELQEYKRWWNRYQCELQDNREEAAARAKKEEENANSGIGKSDHCHGTRSKGSAATNLGQQKGAPTIGTPQEGRDVDPRCSLKSYHGKTNAEKKQNRTWYEATYPKLFNSMPTEEDLCGNGYTIDMSLKLLGVTLKCEEDVNAFFNNVERAAMLKDKEKWVKKTLAKGVHPDSFNRRVTNGPMQLEAQHRCAALTTAVKALKEWDELALDKAKREKEEEGTYRLEFLLSWEGDFYVDGGTLMDFTDFKQPKRPRTK
jgi:hypothetical protein